MTSTTFVPCVTRVDVLDRYRLALAFVDGSKQRIDLEPLLHGPWFGALRDLALFRGVAIDPDGWLVWPNGVKVSPWTLHDWPSAGPSLVAKVQKNARQMRWLRIAQMWIASSSALWLLWSVASWAGWFGREPASIRDMTFPAAILSLTTSQLVLLRWPKSHWGVPLILVAVSAALVVAYVALR
jgi:hypothetical protein